MRLRTLGTFLSTGEPSPTTRTPLRRCRASCMRYVPAGTVTVPPPAAAARSTAAWMVALVGDAERSTDTVDAGMMFSQGVAGQSTAPGATGSPPDIAVGRCNQAAIDGRRPPRSRLLS